MSRPKLPEDKKKPKPTREQINEYHRNWWRKNAEKEKEKHRKDYQKHKEKRKEYQKRYYELHKKKKVTE